jgi:hypothetical protein
MLMAADDSFLSCNNRFHKMEFADVADTYTPVSVVGRFGMPKTLFMDAR